MLLLVTKASKTLNKYMPNPHLGRLISPRHFGAEEKWTGPWAADNDCFQGLDRKAYLKMLAHLTEVDTSNLLFVTAPDVVGDSTASLSYFHSYAPLLHDLELPIAFVGQDGLTISATPWDEFAAFFIGGSTEWKMGFSAARLAREAKERGKLVHMGRVNSVTRVRYAQSIGCDSIDGTQFSMFSDTYIPKFLDWIGNRQGGMAL